MIKRSSVCAAVAAVSLLAAPAHAAEPSMRTVATGLDNPRGLAFGPHGELYVAEAGRGGPGPCQAGRVCHGRSGAITRIAYGHQQRILSHLPSLASPGGTHASGPSDVAVAPDGSLYFIVGIPAPAGMAKLYRDGQEVADLGAYEKSVYPAAVLATGRSPLVMDAGGDALLRIGTRGRISTVAAFPRRTAPAPMPTSVVQGPDGAFYVGQARIWRAEPGRAPQVYATGFTGVIDLAWAPDGHLYVLEAAGALLRVGRRGTHQVVVSGLTAPGGLAVRGRYAYVSDCGVCRGAGSVVRIGL